MITTLKKIIPLECKEKVLLYKEALLNHSYKSLKHKKKVFIFMSADYQNIGGAAITFAQCNMLAHLFPQHQLVEVPLKHSLRHLLVIKKVTHPEDIITTIGGGNMGDTYYGLELIRQQIVKTFPELPYISFPQSFGYQEKLSHSVIHSAKNTYPNHKNALFLIRDQESYIKMRTNFPHCNLQLCPDIVLTLNLGAPGYLRSGILLMLRNDVESILNTSDIRNIKRMCSRVDEHLEISDTFHPVKMNDIAYRNGVFFDFIETIKTKSLVITDRLQGVIFCYITKTPCIAINSLQHKVKNVVNTYMKCNYIKVMDSFDVEGFSNCLKYFSDPDQLDYINHTDSYFKEVYQLIKNQLKTQSYPFQNTIKRKIPTK